jgi:hypothetical protein
MPLVYSMIKIYVEIKGVISKWQNKFMEGQQQDFRTYQVKSFNQHLLTE